jgi:hypothetical protein
MSEKRTKADKAQRQADQLEKKTFRRPAKNQKKKTPREDMNKTAPRIVGDAPRIKQQAASAEAAGIVSGCRLPG